MRLVRFWRGLRRLDDAEREIVRLRGERNQARVRLARLGVAVGELEHELTTLLPSDFFSDSEGDKYPRLKRIVKDRVPLVIQIAEEG